ncbi:hypothetical protein DY000_02021829 [Brassica cretica]|uniref:DUF4283 domain-containing protein n=1 Tax=Brassica cretica TaxID=69181 RepID=A0ABQ7EFQ3_BRACR|nr:hypothetical protein DY000_02021829 [Brassica cretica]
MGQDLGILRGRILARQRIRGMRKFNKTRRLKLRILMLDPAGLACDCTLTFDRRDVQNPEAGWTFVQEPGGWMDFRPGIRRLDGLSSWNPKAGWTLIMEPRGWMDFRPITRRLDGLASWNPETGFLEQCLPLSKPGSVFQCVIQLPLGRLIDGTRCVRSLLWTRGFNSWILGSNGTVVLFQNPEMLLGPEGHLWSPEAALDPEVTFRTRRLSKDPKRLHARDPEVVWEPEGSSRPGGRSEPRGFFLTRRSFGNPEVPLDPEVVLNPKALRSFQDPETAWGPEGSDLITLRLSLDPEFEVTDMVRGCWCGCYDTSARLRCFARLEKQGFNCSMYFTVLLQ